MKKESASQSNSMLALMNEDRSKSICLKISRSTRGADGEQASGDEERGAAKGEREPVRDVSIRYNNIWEMYKKAEASFWTAEEIDLNQT